VSSLGRVAGWVGVIAATALVAMSWVTVALAEAAGEGDGFDGDEFLSLSILIGLGILGAVAWSVYRRHSTKPQEQGDRWSGAPILA
jgi:hypothetical protein